MRTSKLLLSGGIMATILVTLPGCQNSNIQANSFQNTPAQTTAETAPLPIRPAIEIFAGQQKKFDQAYQKAPKLSTPPTAPRGVFTTANLDQLDTIAAFFKSTAQKYDYETVVVLETFPAPSAANSAPSTGKSASANEKSASSTNSSTDQATTSSTTIFTSLAPLQTPYGLLAIDADFYAKVSHDQSFQPTAVPFIVEKEYAAKNLQNMVAPLVKKSFPQAKYLPLFLAENISPDQLDLLATTLQNYLPEKSLVLAQTGLLTTADPQLNLFQQKWIENVTANFDEKTLPNLPLTSFTPAQALWRYLALVHAQTSAAPLPQLEYFREGPKTAQRQVFLTVFGDIMLGRFVRTLMDRTSLDYPFQKMNPAYLKYNDLLVANLEGPIARNPVLTKKGLAFRFAPDVAPILKKYFFDYLSGANNHALDMGADGYEDTRELLKAQGIEPFGDPKHVSQKSVAYADIDGQKLAFLGLDDVDFKIDPTEAVAKVKALVADGYEVIPFFHWGIEYQHLPNQRQKDLAHELIDAGATMILGCHPHVVQTYEIYKGRPIFYSFGNAIFDQYFSVDTQEGLSVGLIIDPQSAVNSSTSANSASTSSASTSSASPAQTKAGAVQAYFFPIKIEQSQMRLMKPEERQKFLERFVTYGSYTDEEKAKILK